ncbi:hypothetical protein [Halovivax limisalsi]|uniref:hypothetical protein n=1 Tax=Halovivax limisalsi TaxID=1453760 RepID=UPI001FFDE1C8|nr:hypothetical protein [Halovivax limisalsi]
MAAVILIALVLSIAAFVGLWWAIERETSNPTVMDRETAERRAMERGGRGDETGSSTDRTADEDGDDVGWD